VKLKRRKIPADTSLVRADSRGDREPKQATTISNTSIQGEMQKTWQRSKQQSTNKGGKKSAGQGVSDSAIQGYKKTQTKTNQTAPVLENAETTIFLDHVQWGQVHASQIQTRGPSCSNDGGLLGLGKEPRYNSKGRHGPITKGGYFQKTKQIDKEK